VTQQNFSAVVFDWAGTTIDFGSFAPMGAFVEAFASFDVAISIADARKPMGLPKRAHIAAILNEPHVAAAWRSASGNAPDEAAIDAVYARFVPLNEEVVTDYATLVPGTAEVVETLRSRGLKIGSTTGYVRSIMERLLPAAAQQGYAPDNLVCADDLKLGRPSPMGMYKCFLDLQVFPAASVVKVDDTVPGIREGVEAGCLTVGVTLCGIAAGLTPEEVARLSPTARATLHEKIGAQLIEAGADHTIETIAGLPELLDRLSKR
jgi:phosphonoacetaldehyde hydrolase